MLAHFHKTTVATCCKLSILFFFFVAIFINFRSFEIRPKPLRAFFIQFESCLVCCFGQQNAPSFYKLLAVDYSHSCMLKWIWYLKFVRMSKITYFAKLCFYDFCPLVTKIQLQLDIFVFSTTTINNKLILNASIFCMTSWKKPISAKFALVTNQIVVPT